MWKKPEYNKHQINEAGKTIVTPNATDSEKKHALKVIDNWRAAHAYPMHTFAINLKRQVVGIEGAVVVQRIKRLDTICGKLSRFPGMQLYRMQDLGGCRVILPTVEDVYKVKNQIESSRIRHEEKTPKDYIKEPNPDTGYRSVHLIYKYKSDKIKEYNGLMIEIQLRTRLQHLWATAVETVGVFTGNGLKFNKGSGKWIKLFKLFSALFALEEGTPLPDDVPNEKLELIETILRLDEELNAIDLKYVERYAEADSYNALTYEDTLIMGQELAPLITPEEDDAKALRFDALLYGIELAYLARKKYGKARSDLFKKVSAIASVANIPEIMVQAELIDKILHTDYVETAGICEFEHIRENLRDLIKYIPVSKVLYDTNFDDEILSVDWKESELENDDLKNYKAKAEFYIRQHMDDAVIAKLKGNIPLTAEDVQALEKALWSEVGTKQDYETAYGQKPLGEFVREIVGLDMNAAKEAFAQYLNDTTLDSRQIYFVNQIVEYIVHNGMMKDLSVLQEAPFTDYGSIVEVFTDLSVWAGIRQVIERVNANALAA